MTVRQLQDEQDESSHVDRDDNQSQPDANEEEDEETDSSSQDSSVEDDDDSLSSSSYDSDIDQEAQRLMAVMRGDPMPGRQTPQEIWDEFVKGMESGQSTALKVTDNLVEWIADMGHNSHHPQESQQDEQQQQQTVAIVEDLCNDLLRILSLDTVVIQHVILGRVCLSLFSTEQQTRLYQSLSTRHASTISFWKLGSDDSMKQCGIATEALWNAMAGSGTWENLTELEIRGMRLESVNHVNAILRFIDKAPKIRQCNLLGMVLSETLLQTEGLWDPLIESVQAMPGFDELQLGVAVNHHKHTESNQSPKHMVSLVSPDVLQTMLTVKPKWWRLALDGLGLNDQHVQIIAKALKASPDCKMNDLLSIQDNPGITADGLQHLYTICCNHKQRMGLVLSDDPTWVATFDLVRPLNNLHRRLEYRKSGGDDDGDDNAYKSRAAWAEWLAVVANLPWIEDARKVNYVWYTLLEQPGLVKPLSS